MQRCNCSVRLGGDIANTVEKENVSPAEIAVLTAIHGEGSVINIRKTIMDKVPHRQERGRLSTHYGHHIVDRLFPGEFTPLPVNLSDIEVGHPAEEAAEGDAGAETAADEPQLPGTEASEAEATPTAGLSADDQIFVDSVNNAKTKLDLYQIAKDNEVDLSKVVDKVEDLRAAILSSLGFA